MFFLPNGGVGESHVERKTATDLFFEQNEQNERKTKQKLLQKKVLNKLGLSRGWGWLD